VITVGANSYFVMGDNRAESEDSRISATLSGGADRFDFALNKGTPRLFTVVIHQ